MPTSPVQQIHYNQRTTELYKNKSSSVEITKGSVGFILTKISTILKVFNQILFTFKDVRYSI